MLTTEELIGRLDQQSEAIKAAIAGGQDTLSKKLQEATARITDIEKKMSREPGGGWGGSGDPQQSAGEQVVASKELSDFTSRRSEGSARIRLKTTIFSTSFPVAPDRQEAIVVKPRRKLTVRDLLASGQTTSNLVQYVEMTARTNAARPVSEGAQKPESALTFVPKEAPVRTIATWIPAARQILDDAPQLQSLIDTELRYMIGEVEENEILWGDGTGQHLFGLGPQATPYSPPFTVPTPTMLDRVLLSIAQVQQSLVPATGVVLNDLDWSQMQTLKDSQGRYLGVGPFGQVGDFIWGLPVVATPAMLRDSWLVGNFTVAAQLVDRMQTEVVISTEHSDFFTRNLIAVRAEERLALLVKVPKALVLGDFGQVS